jgi:hypothetical protein
VVDLAMLHIALIVRHTDHESGCPCDPAKHNTKVTHECLQSSGRQRQLQRPSRAE